MNAREMLSVPILPAFIFPLFIFFSPPPPLPPRSRMQRSISQGVAG